MAQSVQIKAVNHRHEALADLLIAEPHLRMEEISRRLQLSVAWLSTVKHSDSFKDYWALRRKAHADALTVGIREKAAALTELSLDTLLEDVEIKREANMYTAAEARENLDLLRKFGFDGIGTPPAQAPVVNLNLGVVSAETLASARAKLRALQAPEGPVPLDVEAQPVRKLEGQ